MSKLANRWKGFVTAAVGAITGLIAVRWCWRDTAPMIDKQARGLLDQGWTGENQDAGGISTGTATSVDARTLVRLF